MYRKVIATTVLALAAATIGTGVARAEFYDTGNAYRTYDDCRVVGQDLIDRHAAEDFRCSFTNGAFNLYLDQHKESEHAPNPMPTGSAGSL